MPALWPASCRQHGGHKRGGFYWGRMNDPVAIITGTVYSAVTLCKPCAKGVAYIVSFNHHTTSSRAEEATEAWRGEATCPKLPSK